MAKVRLDSRLEIEVIKRLQSASSQKKMPVSDVVTAAQTPGMNKQNMAEKIDERLECLERNLLALVEQVELLDKKWTRRFLQALEDEKKV